jgi:hypothetical protein
VSKALLPKHGFNPDEFFDVFHVLMARGGYCDCEIFYNAVEQSRLKERYWKARAKGQMPRDPRFATSVCYTYNERLRAPVFAGGARGD